MKVVHSPDHRGHAGAPELRRGALVPVAERIQIILATLQEAGFADPQLASAHGLGPALRIHDPDFVAVGVNVCNVLNGYPGH